MYCCTGRKPYMIINEVSREYVDTNRVLDEATFMDRKGIETYNTFNRYIEQVITEMIFVMFYFLSVPTKCGSYHCKTFYILYCV